MVVGKSVAWGSTNAMVLGACAHVGGDQDYFLRLATTQVCGVVPGGARANLWQLGYYYLVLSQQQWQLCGGHVIPEAHKQLGLAYFLQQ